MTATAKRAEKPVVQARSPLRACSMRRALVFNLWTDAKHLAAWWEAARPFYMDGSFNAPVDLKPEA